MVVLLSGALFGSILLSLLSAPSALSYDLRDPLTIQNLMRQAHQPQLQEAEMLGGGATKDDIIDALITQLTSLMNEQRHEDEINQADDEMTEEVWPIFARGGEYGPRYDIFDDFEKRSEAEQIFKDALTKKDLESLLHQPDPSLTVQELPPNPKISFRKGYHDIATTRAPPIQTNKATGMKEVPVYNPIQQNSAAPKNPLMALFESHQLRALAAGQRK